MNQWTIWGSLRLLVRNRSGRLKMQGIASSLGAAFVQAQQQISSTASQISERLPTFAQGMKFVKSAGRGLGMAATYGLRLVSVALNSASSGVSKLSSQVETFATSLVSVKSDAENLTEGKEWQRQSFRGALYHRVKANLELIQRAPAFFKELDNPEAFD